jgi:hypothetical protein
MQVKRAVITLEFQSCWLASTGAAGSGLADAPAYLDADGCPALPMTMVRGQLRDTATAVHGELNDDLKTLFGLEGHTGALRFIGEARLPAGARAWFRANPEARAQLFRRLPSTKISKTGVAEDKTLRSIEACVPLTLTGEVELDQAEDVAVGDSWIDLLDQLCAATLFIGREKTNGLGRVIASCSEVAEA